MIMVCGQKVALGRINAGQTVTVHVSDTTLAIELDHGEPRTVRRTPPRKSVTSKPTATTGHPCYRPDVKGSPGTGLLSLSCLKTRRWSHVLRRLMRDSGSPVDVRHRAGSATLSWASPWGRDQGVAPVVRARRQGAAAQLGASLDSEPSDPLKKSSSVLQYFLSFACA